jgi:hypothetical protein
MLDANDVRRADRKGGKSQPLDETESGLVYSKDNTENQSALAHAACNSVGFP